MKQPPPQKFRERLRRFLRLQDVPPFVRRAIIAVIGGTVLLFGIALIILPGPAVVVIPVGLAILATEFVWAQRWLRKARGLFNQAKQRLSRKGRDEAGIIAPRAT